MRSLFLVALIVHIVFPFSVNAEERFSEAYLRKNQEKLQEISSFLSMDKDKFRVRVRALTIRRDRKPDALLELDGPEIGSGWGLGFTVRF